MAFAFGDNENIPGTAGPDAHQSLGNNNTLNGATFPFTPLRSIPADIIHFGSLLFGLWAAYATWRVLRGGRTAIDAGDTTGAEGADGTRSPRVR